MTSLGKFTKEDDLRSIWPNEERDFSKWLTEPENLALLGEALNIELVDSQTEQWVGNFRSDILASDSDGGKVIIENQLEKTDHDHLGKLMTYAGGHDGVHTLVWIAKNFREEHRAALDWLNEVSNEETTFFGIEIELWRIDGGLPAPRFSVISRPNGWIKAARKEISKNENPRNENYLKFWSAFVDEASKHDPRLARKAPRPSPYHVISIGMSGFWLAGAVSERDQFMRTEFVMNNDENGLMIDSLMADRSGIEERLGNAIEWDKSPGSKRTKITITDTTTDPTNEKDWPRQHQWLIGNLSKFYDCFQPQLNSLRDIGASQRFPGDEEA